MVNLNPDLRREGEQETEAELELRVEQILGAERDRLLHDPDDASGRDPRSLLPSGSAALAELMARFRASAAAWRERSGVLATTPEIQALGVVSRHAGAETDALLRAIAQLNAVETHTEDLWIR